MDPVNSPSKVAQKEAPEYYSEKEKVSEKLQPTTTRSYRRNITRDKDTPPPETNDSAAAATSRTARRTRPTVSYAEPSLRDKMRREETGFVDAVKGEGKMRRGSRKKAGKEDRELPISDIKNEDLDIVGPTTVHWMDLPPLKSAIHLEEADADRAKNPKTEVVVMMDGENHPLLPASIITSRKRRISSLVASLPGTESEPGDLKRKAEPTDEQRGRNSRRSMNRPRSRSPEVEMENVGRGMRRSSLDSGTSPGDDRAGRRRRMMI